MINLYVINDIIHIIANIWEKAKILVLEYIYNVVIIDFTEIFLVDCFFL